jgi:hypothetical protein
MSARFALAGAMAFLALAHVSAAVAGSPNSRTSAYARPAAAIADPAVAPPRIVPTQQVIPRTMSYQGVLTDSAGNPSPDGSHQFTFRIYDHPTTPGGPLWEESHTGVTVTHGGFGVILGASTSSPHPLNLPFDEPYFLGISVDGGPELLPRVVLASVPYSLRAASVENGSITDSSIASGQVLKNLNGLTDNVRLVAGSNVTLTKSGQTLVISSTAEGDSLNAGMGHNVRAFGAKGDGKTDDTAAIQAAITAAEADGSYEVVFPDGFYMVPNGGLVCKRETLLRGIGDATIAMSSATATLVKWASPSAGRYRGGGAERLAFIGTGGGISIGCSFGDPSHPAYYANRLALRECDVSGFGYNLVIDGVGALSTGEASATDGFALLRCNIRAAVHVGLFVKTNSAIETSTIDGCYFGTNGKDQNDGAAIALSSSGGGGGTLPSAALGLSCISSTFNENGNGTLGQIHVPASAWIELKMNGCSFESITTGRTHIALLSEGSATYGGPRSRAQLNNSIFQQFLLTSYKEPLIFRAGDFMLTGNKITSMSGGSPFALISFGINGQYAGLTLLGNYFEMAGEIVNARVLDLTGAQKGNNTFTSFGNVFSGFGKAPALTINPTPIGGAGDLLGKVTDFRASSSMFVNDLGVVAPNDPNLIVRFDISRVNAYGKLLSIFRQSGTALETGVLQPVVPTSSLPPAGPENDGKILIEDAGSGDRNLVIYAGGQRFRIDAGAAF